MALEVKKSATYARTAALVASTCVGATLWVGVRLLDDVRNAQDWVTHTVEVQLQAERIRTDLRGMGRAALDRLVIGVVRDGDIDPWRQVLQADLDALSALVRDNNEQSVRTFNLQRAIKDHMHILSLLRQGDMYELTARREHAQQIEDSITDFQAVEAKLLAQRRSTLDDDLRLHFLALGSLGVLAIALLLGAASLGARLIRARAEEKSAEDRAGELSEAHRRTRYFAQQLLKVEEAERRAIARELHDDLAQRLAALKLNLQLMQSADQEQGKPLAAAIDIADQSIQQVRRRAVALRPQHLDELGLGPALASHVEEQARLAGIRSWVDVQVAGWNASDDWNAHVFRIVQEAVRNAIVHGRPSNMQVRLHGVAGTCRLTVEDDGRGLPDTVKGGLGLAHMRERTEMLGGRFRIESRPEGGVRVACEWETSGEPHATLG